MAQGPTQPNKFLRIVNSISENLDPLLKLLKRFWGFLIGLGLAAIFLMVAWYYLGGVIDEKPYSAEVATEAKWFGRFLFFLFICFIIVIIGWFLIVFRGREVSNQQLSAIIIYCYLFTWLSIVVSVLPFLLLPMGDTLPRLMTTSPIGIVKGCSQEPASGKSSVPEELQCDKNTDQWIVNVGGRVVLNDEDRDPWAPVRVEGGLVVPLYFIVLALVGSAVSMTRRVPEYQERTGPGSLQPLTNGKAREYLVLQIMQVISAPLIAVTAYYLIDPSSRASTVALGFVSGFASETILLYIRAIADKLQPEGASKPTESDIEVAPSTLEFGDQPVNSSAPRTVALTNDTEKPLIVESIQLTGDFTHSCKVPMTVVAGATQQIEVTFTPKVVGACKGVLTIVDDGAGSPRSVLLTGNGVQGNT